VRAAAPRAAHAARVVRAAAQEWLSAGEWLSLSLVADAEIRKLNRDWRGKDAPTDVLSWPPGEIVISLDTARRQAREGGWPLRAELRRLLAHGLCHCRGYDHLSAAQAMRMAAAEKRLLGVDGMVGESLKGRH
jgi:probable rRNA maturation factor